ncbi:MAG: hypothetical protein AAFY88_25380, partial [Acidobacteriota bacterium]
QALAAIDPVDHGVVSVLRLIGPGWQPIDSKGLSESGEEAILILRDGGFAEVTHRLEIVLAWPRPRLWPFGGRGPEVHSVEIGVIGDVSKDREAIPQLLDAILPAGWQSAAAPHAYRGLARINRVRLTVDGESAKRSIAAGSYATSLSWIKGRASTGQVPVEVRALSHAAGAESSAESPSPQGANAVAAAAAQASVGDIGITIENHIHQPPSSSVEPPAATNSGEEGRKKGRRGPGRPAGGGRTVNDRMMDEITKDPVASQAKTAQQWADELGCSESAVKKAPAWESLRAAAQRAKADRAGQ